MVGGSRYLPFVAPCGTTTRSATPRHHYRAGSPPHYPLPCGTTDELFSTLDIIINRRNGSLDLRLFCLTSHFVTCRRAGRKRTGGVDGAKKRHMVKSAGRGGQFACFTLKYLMNAWRLSLYEGAPCRSPRPPHLGVFHQWLSMTTNKGEQRRRAAVPRLWAPPRFMAARHNGQFHWRRTGGHSRPHWPQATWSLNDGMTAIRI